jgi:superfamily II DNA helicase RecQ
MEPTSSSSRKKKQTEKIVVPSEIEHPTLYQAIVKWRLKKASESALPPYCIIQQKALLGLTNLMPDTKEAMSLIPCMGKITIDKYGDDVLEIIKKYLLDNNLTTKLPCKK